MTENGVEEAGSEKSGTADFPRPGLDVPLSTLSLAKRWDGNGTKPSSVIVHIQDASGEFTQDVTLSGDSWAQTVYVPAGPEGHVWQVTETSQSEGWVIEGYEATGLVANGTVGAGGTLQGLATQSASVTITNRQIKYEFRILKVGSDGTTLKGATFEVSGSGSQTTGDDGLATFGGLVPGTYAVTEDQVPAGYTLPGTHTLVIRDDGGATWDGSEITNTGDDQGTKYFQVTVTNDRIANLPETGGVGVIPFAMRKRSLANTLKLAPSAGLYSVLTQEKTLQEAACSTGIRNLYLLDIEPNIPNPVDILSSNHYENLVKTLSGLFDYVIFDTPPLGTFIDAAVLGALTDGTLLVVKRGATKRAMASDSPRDFVLVSNVNDAFQNELETRTHWRADSRIKFVGTVYDRELLSKIRENAHGHRTDCGKLPELHRVGSLRPCGFSLLPYCRQARHLDLSTIDGSRHGEGA